MAQRYLWKGAIKIFSLGFRAGRGRGVEWVRFKSKTYKLFFWDLASIVPYICVKKVKPQQSLFKKLICILKPDYILDKEVPSN